jgi:hypothetical protein
MSSRPKSSRRALNVVQALLAVAALGAIALYLHSLRDCGIDGERSRCKAAADEATKYIANGYYCSLVAYRDACGAFPTTEQGLLALTAGPTTPPLCKAYPARPLLTQVVPDGWGKPFTYEAAADGQSFRMISPGRVQYDRQQGWQSHGVDAGYPRAGINLCF